MAGINRLLHALQLTTFCGFALGRKVSVVDNQPGMPRTLPVNDGWMVLETFAVYRTDAPERAFLHFTQVAFLRVRNDIAIKMVHISPGGSIADTRAIVAVRVCAKATVIADWNRICAPFTKGE